MKTAFILFVSLASSIVDSSDGFEFMKRFKITPPVDIAKQEEAKKKFGDKKLVVITGTSSGLGPRRQRPYSKRVNITSSERFVIWKKWKP
jgi:hypothetical protein